ncbi:hypothetical protein H8E07_06625 [bacterium]|nr:hypothetical protein [bacterium]
MTRLLLSSFLLSLLFAASAQAGDPCPIGLTLHEVTPEWRTRVNDLAALESQRSWVPGGDRR